MTKLTIDIFADIACPWCYIGERRLERALAQRPDLEVERHWHPFQLQPGLPSHGLPWGEFASAKFGAKKNQMFEHVSAIAATEGLTFNFDRMPVAPNTLDAHRLILFAAINSREWEMAEALFAAYFSDGRDITQLDELVALATEVGLDGEAARGYLQSELGIDEVAASQEMAAQADVNGVPLFIFNGRYGLPGAQAPETFLKLIDQLVVSDEQG